MKKYGGESGLVEAAEALRRAAEAGVWVHASVVAAVMGRSKGAILKDVAANKLPHVRLGPKCVRFPAREILALIEQSTVPATKPAGQ